MPETFVWPVQRPVQTTHKPAVKTLGFGDGYEQRARKGLNSDLPKHQITVRFGNRLEAQPASDFLKARAGAESFYWTPPGGERALFKCSRWRINDQIRPVTITATFEQVVA